MEKILSFDVGTSTLKGILVDRKGTICGSSMATYQVSFPQEGYAEEDPSDWWNGVVQVTRDIMKKTGADSSDVKGMVFSTQACNIIPIGEDGTVLQNAISWIDSRADVEASEIVEMIGGAAVCESVIGTVFSGMDSLPKMRWFIKNRPELAGKLACFVDVNGYLTFRATGQATYDIASASFLGYDREHGCIIGDLIATTGFDPAKFPRIVKSFERIANLTPEAARELGLTTSTAVFGGTDDIQSTALGAGRAGGDEAHLYLGTSGWVAVGTNKIAALSNGGGCIMSADPSLQLWVYSTQTCCATFNWFIDNFYSAEKKDLGEERLYSYLGDVAAAMPVGSANLIFNPWLSGERCPIQDVQVRGGFLNLGMSHTKAHMLRAVMESVAYNLRWCHESMENDLGRSSDTVRILGGGTKNKVWMQIFADVFNRKIEVIKDTQIAGAIGGAFLAAIGLGYYTNFDDVKEWSHVEHTYTPNPENARLYATCYANYKDSYASLKDFYKRINAK
jgi:xylulokinase